MSNIENGWLFKFAFSVPVLNSFPSAVELDYVVIDEFISAIKLNILCSFWIISIPISSLKNLSKIAFRFVVKLSLRGSLHVTRASEPARF